jgi:hypothetical protein
LPLTDDGLIEFGGGQFGWEEEQYNDAYTKAKYAVQYLYQSGFDRNDELDMFVELIKEHTGAKEVVFNVEELQEGDIDHQSSDVCSDAFVSKQILKDFLFNPMSYLYTDNDNH